MASYLPEHVATPCRLQAAVPALTLRERTRHGLADAQGQGEGRVPVNAAMPRHLLGHVSGWRHGQGTTTYDPPLLTLLDLLGQGCR